MTTPLDYALRYVELDWPVLPCYPQAKRPMTAKGYLDASLDVEQVKAWWTATPDANVAIAIPEGVVIVDVDDPEALERLRHSDRELPATITSETARGAHYWYRHTTGPDVAAAIQLDGVDLKCRGGYVLVPPSIHPSGEPYRWRVPPSPNNLADAPDWLEEELRKERGTVLSEGALGVSAGEVLAGVTQGERNQTLFRYACQLRRRNLGLEEAQVLVSHAAAHCIPPLPPAEVAQLLRSAWRYEPGGATGPEPGGVVEIRDLLAEEFPPLKWVVPGLICEGLVILASAPKVGKSWMAFNLSLAVTNGGFFLGRYRVEAGEVLFLDLEQPPRRTQARLRALPWTSEHSGLWFAHDWPTHDRGGFSQLAAWLSDHPAARLVVVDVLQKLIGDRPKGGNAYEVDYRIYSDLKAVADQAGVTVLALHHDRKTDTSDDLDKVSGSRALVGSADGVLILSRRRGEFAGRLMATGREITDQRIPIHWSPDHRVWVASELPDGTAANVGELIRNQVAGPVPV